MNGSLRWAVFQCFNSCGRLLKTLAETVQVVLVKAHASVALAAGHDIQLPRELERKRRNRAARWALGHELRYSLVWTDDELALALPFVRIVGEHCEGAGQLIGSA